MLETTNLRSDTGLREFTFSGEGNSYTVWATSERDARDLAEDLEEQDKLALADRFYRTHLGY